MICQILKNDFYILHKKTQSNNIFKKIIDKMIGWALRQPNYNLSLDLNVLFWKRILKRHISIEDLKHVEIYRY